MQNKSLIPRSITRDGGLITCRWADGFTAAIKLEDLRSECTCAECSKQRRDRDKSGMITLWQFVEGKNDLIKLEKVGSYALNPHWGDGHKVGIYTYETWRMIFEKYALTDSETA